jgi:hypothetical protein
MLNTSYQNITTLYNTPQIFLSGSPGNKSYIFVTFKEIEVEVEQEFVLFDFNAILSSVGGSMGLFLGFSFLDCTMKLIHNSRRWWRRTVPLKSQVEKADKVTESKPEPQGEPTTMTMLKSKFKIWK